ncbi:MAG TPA: hypothetical protein VKZ53_31915 [Candidatus Angelobacter sp.]|nr:hypothetical protein [Candidatus Angelobacter sp.]
MKWFKQAGSEQVAESVGAHLAKGFFKAAEELRASFDFHAVSRQSEGLTPFTYAYLPDAYNFLTASAEEVLDEPAVAGLTETLRAWARTLSCSHVSTPQVRVFPRGCSRFLVPDQASPGWHYLFCMTRGTGSEPSCVQLAEENPSEGNRTISIQQAVNLELQFNELLVHRAGAAYAIAGSKSSIDPVQAVVFLDGYLW